MKLRLFFNVSAIVIDHIASVFRKLYDMRDQWLAVERSLSCVNFFGPRVSTRTTNFQLVRELVPDEMPY